MNMIRTASTIEKIIVLISLSEFLKFKNKKFLFEINWVLGMGDWVLGIGVWGR